MIYGVPVQSIATAPQDFLILPVMTAVAMNGAFLDADWPSA